MEAAEEGLQKKKSLLLVDFHGWVDILSGANPPRTKTNCTLGLWQKAFGERASVLTDAEAAFYVFLDICSEGGLRWRSCIVSLQVRPLQTQSTWGSITKNPQILHDYNYYLVQNLLPFIQEHQ